MKTDKLLEARQHDLRFGGSTDQLYSVRRVQLIEGPGAGIRLIEVKPAAGLAALFNENHALDLYELRFRGINIGYMNKTGLVNGRGVPLAHDFHRTWPGGVLATCGLRNTGPDCLDGDEYHPIHGLIGGGAANQVSTRTDEELRQIIIEGTVQEAAMFGHNLLLRRRIVIPIDGAEIKWQDQIVNQAAEPEPVFILYHFNFGYPFLSPQLKLTFPPGEVIPRTDEARQGLDTFDQITLPVDGQPEQVFFHYPLQEADRNEQTVQIKMEQPECGISAYLSYDRAQLPVLTQWKSMKSGDYALGIEPGNSLIRGRLEELAEDYQQILPGYAAWPLNLSLRME